MLNRFISFLFISFLSLSSIIAFMVALLIWTCTFWWDPRLKLLHQFTCFWASLYVWIMPPWKVSVTGREHFKDKAYVVVANHQSQLDILVAFGLFKHFKWVSKAEMFKVPLLGWNMALNRYIPIKRGDKGSASHMFQAAKKHLKQGSSVFLFPEGTRSQTGIMKPFKPGAFQLAHDTQSPILPVVINGTCKALPKHSINFHGKHKITLEILPEIPYEEFAPLDIETTGLKVYHLLEARIDEHQEKT